MRSAGILTLGCKVNTYESEYVINKLKENNYEIKPFTDICDVYIINTCTVTNSSDSKSKKMISPGLGLCPRPAHLWRALNQLAPSPTTENLGTTPISKYPH